MASGKIVMEGGRAVLKPVVDAVMPVAAAVGLASSPEAEAGPVMRNGRRILEAWHGSPHRFPPVRELEMPDGTRLLQDLSQSKDIPEGAKVLAEHPMGRFDMSKIGTGEGAQAYGHGLYFADAEDVARGYRDALRPPAKVAHDVTQDEAIDISIDLGVPTFLVNNAIDRVARTQGVDEAIAQIDDLAPKLIAANNGYGDDMLKEKEILLRIRDRLEVSDINKGALYRTEIDIDPDTLLDWDKPLSEQTLNRVYEHIDRNISPEAARALQDGYYTSVNAGRTPDGADFIEAMGREFGQRETSAILRDSGIPGIRYLDGMSRGQNRVKNAAITPVNDGYSLVVSAHDGTKTNLGVFPSKEAADKAMSDYRYGGDSYNYVMFDDAPIRIVERGAASPEAMLATALAGAGGLYAQKRAQERGRLEQTRQKLAEMYSANLAPLSPEQRAGYHGTIQPPNHPNVEWIAQALDKFNRRLEGSPAQLLNFEATAPWLRKLSYGQDPGAMETLGASMEWMP